MKGSVYQILRTFTGSLPVIVKQTPIFLIERFLVAYYVTVTFLRLVHRTGRCHFELSLTAINNVLWLKL